MFHIFLNIFDIFIYMFDMLLHISICLLISILKGARALGDLVVPCSSPWLPQAPEASIFPGLNFNEFRIPEKSQKIRKPPPAGSRNWLKFYGKCVSWLAFVDFCKTLFL